MKKSVINLIIDAIMLVLMAGVLSIGLMVKYVLPSGQEKWEIYGDNLDITLLGLDRHQWGQIHYIAGIVLGVLLILHILLHWKQIISIFKHWIPQKALQTAMISCLFCIMTAVMIIPFVTEPVIGESLSRNRNLIDESTSITSVNQEQKSEEMKYSSLDINGQMTLNEIASKYQISSKSLKNKLGIPSGSSNYERIGRLRKLYSFSMQDVKDIIHSHQKNKRHE